LQVQRAKRATRERIEKLFTNLKQMNALLSKKLMIDNNILNLSNLPEQLALTNLSKKSSIFDRSGLQSNFGEKIQISNMRCFFKE
jgi:hypothetical protein